MKRRNFLVVAGTAAAAGCYVVLTEDVPGGFDDRLRTILRGEDPDGNGNGGPDGPGIDVTDTSFEPAPPDDPVADACLRASVENVGAERLASVELLPEFYDRSGAPLATGFARVRDLDPGETWDACVTYPGRGDDVADHLVRGAYEPGSTVDPPEEATVSTASLRTDGCDATVAGVARNDGPARPYLEARAKLHDRDDRVVAVAHDGTTDLAAGERWSFTMDATFDRPAADVVAGYDVELTTAWW